MLSFELEALGVTRERLETLERRGTIGPRQAKQLAEVRELIAQAQAEGIIARPASHPRS